MRAYLAHDVLGLLRLTLLGLLGGFLLGLLGLLPRHLNAVVGLIPLTEGGGIDLQISEIRLLCFDSSGRSSAIGDQHM